MEIRYHFLKAIYYDLNKEYYFEFEGIYHHPQIYINDELAYERQYGYSTCLFNATKYLKQGNNIIKVIAINSDQPNSRWYSGAGIYRNVHLYVLPKIHIIPRSFKINTIDYKEGKISFKCLLNVISDLTIEIFDNDNKPILKKESSLIIHIYGMMNILIYIKPESQ